MRIGVVRETAEGERRVALTPGQIAPLTKAGHEILIESGAGRDAGFTDDAFRSADATLHDTREHIVQQAEMLVQVRMPTANPDQGEKDIGLLRSDMIVIGLGEPLSRREPIEALAQTGVTSFALELLPRITRAQAMDVLSSQANIAGYKAVILAANNLPRLFPMMMTAAGTITPARVFVVGAGVAGLQAIATARRLGAKVSATDVRAEVKEQVESLGATFLHVAQDASGEGGYAAEQTAEQQRRQQQMMNDAVAEADVVITTAAIPGKRAPVLVSAEMVSRMKPGSVVVDLAAERGGNCELTRPDEVVIEHDVTILGPHNVPAQVAYHASQTYARNITAFVQHLAPEGELHIDRDDQITADTLLTRAGEIVQPKVRAHFDLPAVSTSHTQTAPDRERTASTSSEQSVATHEEPSGGSGE